MSQTTEKQTPEEIVENLAGTRESTAYWLQGIRADADNFVEQFRDPNALEYPKPIDWDLVALNDLPREFVELLDRVANYEVRL